MVDFSFEVDVKIKLIAGGKLPEFKTDGAVCADCYARVDESCWKKIVPPFSRMKIPLGFALELPKGWEAVIRPRSSLTYLGIDNGIGTIDYDYRGEVSAVVVNNTDEDFFIENGDRICQLAIRKAPKVSFEVVDELSQTERGAGGFGSTGKRG